MIKKTAEECRSQARDRKDKRPNSFIFLFFNFTNLEKLQRSGG